MLTVGVAAATVAVSIDSSDVNVATPTATVSFAFSEAPTAFTLADTAAACGVLCSLQQVDATHYTATFTSNARTDIATAPVSVTGATSSQANANPRRGGS